MPIALIVEVANTTLNNDLTRKAAIYAQAGVPEYWVADVDGRLVHQMWSPDGDGYAECRVQALGTMLHAVCLPIALPRPDPA